MEILSVYLIAAAVAWLVAHLIKAVVYKSKGEFQSWRRVFSSGGMPSAHTTTVVALTTVIGLKDGMGTAVFALASLFAAIVMYDASHVRRATGEQAKAIEQLIQKTDKKIPMPYSSRGHRLAEVFVGAVLGAAIGLIAVVINTTL